jgi:hypothetical protein
MLGGALAAGLVLVVFYAVVQPGAASKGTAATNVFVATLTHLASPGVAGIADHSKKGTAKPAAAPSGGYLQPVYNI